MAAGADGRDLGMTINSAIYDHVWRLREQKIDDVNDNTTINVSVIKSNLEDLRLLAKERGLKVQKLIDEAIDLFIADRELNVASEIVTRERKRAPEMQKNTHTESDTDLDEPEPDEAAGPTEPTEYVCRRPQCGHRWTSKIDKPPKACPACKQYGWNKPREATPRECSQCGHEWTAKVGDKLDACPRCHSTYWNEPRDEWACANCGEWAARHDRKRSDLDLSVQICRPCALKVGQ
jgi:predicted Zn-ribbon and HTH transcriptional regulator